jgi:hypothetical protein
MIRNYKTTANSSRHALTFAPAFLNWTGPAKRGVVAVFFGVLTAAASATPTVSGNLKTTANKPILASITLHDISTARVQGQQPFDRQFASKSDGSFTLTGVPAGRYQVCVDAPQENVLDPCLWSTAPTVVTIPATGNVTGLAIQVATGSRLTVHVNDPQALLPAPKGGIAGRALSIRVITANNHQVNFRLLGASARTRDHYLPVPFDQSMILVIEASGVSLSDSKDQKYTGNALRIPVRIPGGGSKPTVIVNVANP